ncbi:hypothetical protein QBC39DRAFT_361847 [Podospora conica]|nr:hypothetical protein QBC39DRAFT_361847 [Schizothecium conicum]
MPFLHSGPFWSPSEEGNPRRGLGEGSALVLLVGVPLGLPLGGLPRVLLGSLRRFLLAARFADLLVILDDLLVLRGVLLATLFADLLVRLADLLVLLGDLLVLLGKRSGDSLVI